MSLLSLSGLTRRFGSLTALDALDLRLEPGARHAVIGPNGAGKSTLLHLVAGALRPTAGRIRFAGRDITRTGPARRARLGLARTFQTPAVCDSLTVRDNISLVGRTPDAREVLDALGLGAHARLPAGRLPHGTRRLLEIGVALAGRPRLLLLDEPAAGLTADDVPRLLAVLAALPGAPAVLLVEHHMDVVGAVADTVTVLHHGRVLATGSPAEVAADQAVAGVYFGQAAP